MRVSVVSESAFTVGDHGVHTAFVEQVRALRELGVDARVNRPSRRYAVVAHTPGPFAAACLKNAGERAVAVAHVTPDTLRDSLRFEPRWRRLAREYLARFYALASMVVAVSTSVRDELEGLGVDPGAIWSIPNGIGGERFRAPASAASRRAVQEGGRSGRPLVIGVGQVQPRKGIGAFAATAAALPDYDFAWVGGRPFGALTEAGDQLEAALRNPPANLRFVGRVSDDEVVAYYQAADAFLFPSRQENFGQVVIEAAAAGLPLVLSQLEVFSENFGDGAILASDRDLASAIRRLVEDREHRSERIAAAGTLAARFTARHSAAALVELLAELPRPGRVKPTMAIQGDT